MNFCKFCTTEDGNHASDCSREQPNADVRYRQGYQDGRAGGGGSSNDGAYLAGWNAGKVAAYVHDGRRR